MPCDDDSLFTLRFSRSILAQKEAGQQIGYGENTMNPSNLIISHIREGFVFDLG